ncbi:MAG: Na(+)/H(+) antiporter subunit D, partial [Nitrospirota bacterium]
MMIGDIPPFVLFFIGALLLPFFRGWGRVVLLCLIPVAGAFNLLHMSEGMTWNLTLFSYQLTPLRIDRLSLLFGYLFHLAAFLGIVFSLHLKETSQHVVGLLYAGSAIGAVFAGDLITLFVFWELLAITSVFLIWARRSSKAIQAGFRYLIIQISSGLLLLVGILIHGREFQSVSFDVISWDETAAWLFFIAFGVKAAFPLLHNWLTDAYPEATPTGTVFLSAFT